MNYFIKNLLLIIVLFLFFIPHVSLALCDNCHQFDNDKNSCDSHFDSLGCKWEYNNTNTGGTVSIQNPIPNTSPQELIGRVIKAVLGISGSLALLMFVYGGFTWMLSGGNSEKVTKGKNTLVWAAIGLIVIFSSYALVNAIFTGLAGT